MGEQQRDEATHTAPAALADPYFDRYDDFLKSLAMYALKSLTMTRLQ